MKYKMTECSNLESLTRSRCWLWMELHNHPLDAVMLTMYKLMSLFQWLEKTTLWNLSHFQHRNLFLLLYLLLLWRDEHKGNCNKILQAPERYLTLILWSKILEKVIATELVRFPTLSGIHHWTLLNLMNPAHTLTPQFFKTILILATQTCEVTHMVSSGFLAKIFACILICLVCATWPHPSYSSFDHP